MLNYGNKAPIIIVRLSQKFFCRGNSELRVTVVQDKYFKSFVS